MEEGNTKKEEQHVKRRGYPFTNHHLSLFPAGRLPIDVAAQWLTVSR
jgi:hypothetical protein